MFSLVDVLIILVILIVIFFFMLKKLTDNIISSKKQLKDKIEELDNLKKIIKINGKK